MIKQLVATILGSTLIAFTAVLGVAGLASNSNTPVDVVVEALDPRPLTAENIQLESSDEPSGYLEEIEEVSVGTAPTTSTTSTTSNTTVLKTADDVAEQPDETVFHIMASQSGVTWGLDRVDGSRDGTYNYVGNGSGVRIYIVDTGIDATHREFGSRVVNGFDAFGQNLDQTDCNGHGTHVAGIAAGSYYGVAKSATLVPVRVMDCNGVGNTTTLTDGIEWILASHSGGTGIVNMSLGGNKDERVNALTSRLVDAGLVVVVAAGNSGADACNYSPASARGAIAVAAIDMNDNRASFSNYGSCVDISAPGVQINSANSLNHSVSLKKSGTSQASPFVAGAIATYISQGQVTSPSQAESRLNELAQNGVVTVEVAPEELVEPAPEPIAEPEPLPQTPEPSPSPVVDEPSLPEPVSDVNDVIVIQSEPGSNVGTLKWPRIEGSDGYRVYKTTSLKPGWRLHWVAQEDWFERTIVDKVGSTAIYKVFALVGGKEVEVGRFQYEPVE